MRSTSPAAANSFIVHRWPKAVRPVRRTYSVSPLRSGRGSGARVEFVDEIRKRERVGFHFMQCDVEVLGVKQVSDDAVNRRVQLAQIARGRGDFGDPVQGRLQALGASLLRDVLRNDQSCGASFEFDRSGEQVNFEKAAVTAPLPPDLSANFNPVLGRRESFRRKVGTNVNNGEIEKSLARVAVFLGSGAVDFEKSSGGWIVKKVG